MGINTQINAAQAARRIETDPFICNADFNVLAANATQTVLIPVTNDSDFVIDASNLVAYTAVGVLAVNPDYMVSLIDTGSGRSLQDSPTHVNNCMGSGILPYIWPEPKMFKGSSNINVTLVNLTAVPARVSVTFIGRKIFYLGNYTRDLMLSGIY